MAGGKQAARSIDKQLMSLDRWQQLIPELQYGQTIPKEAEPARRHEGRMLDAPTRARCIAEVVAALTHTEAHEEADRCLRCDLAAPNVS